MHALQFTLWIWYTFGGRHAAGHRVHLRKRRRRCAGSCPGGRARDAGGGAARAFHMGWGRLGDAGASIHACSHGKNMHPITTDDVCLHDKLPVSPTTRLVCLPLSEPRSFFFSSLHRMFAEFIHHCPILLVMRVLQLALRHVHTPPHVAKQALSSDSAGKHTACFGAAGRHAWGGADYHRRADAAGSA